MIHVDPGSVESVFEVRRCLARGEHVAILGDRIEPGDRHRSSRVPLPGRRGRAAAGSVPAGEPARLPGPARGGAAPRTPALRDLHRAAGRAGPAAEARARGGGRRAVDELRGAPANITVSERPTSGSISTTTGGTTARERAAEGAPTGPPPRPLAATRPSCSGARTRSRPLASALHVGERTPAVRRSLRRKEPGEDTVGETVAVEPEPQLAQRELRGE